MIGYPALRSHSQKPDNVGIVAESHDSRMGDIRGQQVPWPEGLRVPFLMSPCLLPTPSQSMNEYNAVYGQS